MDISSIMDMYFCRRILILAAQPQDAAYKLLHRL